MTFNKADAGDTAQLVLIALGSNIEHDGNACNEIVDEAIKRLRPHHIFVTGASPLYKTPSIPAGSPDFINAVVKAKTALNSLETLDRLRRIEGELGRTRQERWGPRVLDLDLLAFGDMVLPSLETQLRWARLPLERQMAETPEELILPHPRIQDRGFVLLPLRDVVPDWVHPTLKTSVTRMIDSLPRAAKEGIERL